MKRNILILSHSVYKSNIDYNSKITNRLFNILEKGFHIKYLRYYWKSKALFSFFESNNFIPINKSRGKLLSSFKAFFIVYYRNLRELRKNNAELVWIPVTSSSFSFFVFVYPLLIKRNYFVQLYTPSVNKNKFLRNIFDLIISFNLKFFKNIGGSSDLLNERYRLKGKLLITDVGVSDFGFVNRDFKELNLVYIGTLNNRKIWESIRGVVQFKEKFPERKLTYQIIGTGNIEETEKVTNEIKYWKAESFIKYNGFVHDDKVMDIFKICNVGVSYVPINSYYQNPSTKTLEYLLSGMPVIATDNPVRRKLIGDKFGVLCQDNPESFCNGIERLYERRLEFDSLVIRAEFENQSLNYKVANEYIPMLLSLMP